MNKLEEILDSYSWQIKVWNVPMDSAEHKTERYKAQQQILQLVQEIIGEDERTDMESEVGGYDNQVRNELRGEQKSKKKELLG